MSKKPSKWVQETMADIASAAGGVVAAAVLDDAIAERDDEMFTKLAAFMLRPYIRCMKPEAAISEFRDQWMEAARQA